MSDSKAKFKQYITNKKVLIVDGEIAVRATVARAIIALGADSQNVHLSSDFDSAVQLSGVDAHSLSLADF